MSRDFATGTVTSTLFCYPWGLNSVLIKTVSSSCDSRELPAWVFLCSLKFEERKKLRFKGKMVYFFNQMNFIIFLFLKLIQLDFQYNDVF